LPIHDTSNGIFEPAATADAAIAMAALMLVWMAVLLRGERHSGGQYERPTGGGGDHARASYRALSLKCLPPFFRTVFWGVDSIQNDGGGVVCGCVGCYKAGFKRGVYWGAAREKPARDI
jgi:hypothetical protein